MNHRRMIIALLPLAAAACSDDDPSNGDPGGLSTALTGVYEIDAWTLNDMGCDTEGPSILATEDDGSFYVNTFTFFGVTALQAATCVDVETCAAEAAEESINLGGFAFEEGSDASGWTESGYVLSSSGGGPCSGQVFTYELTAPSPGTVALTRRSTLVNDVPRGADDFCDEEAAEAMAASQPCDQLEVVTGSFVQDI